MVHGFDLGFSARVIENRRFYYGTENSQSHFKQTNIKKACLENHDAFIPFVFDTFGFIRDCESFTKSLKDHA